MIVTLIVLWVLISATFFASLAFMASRPLPAFEPALARDTAPETVWQHHEEHHDLVTSHMAVG